LSVPQFARNAVLSLSAKASIGNRHNASHHRQQKAERGTSGDFCCPSACDC
jgi:hypothetical protein